MNNFQIERKKIFSQDENEIETILGQNVFKKLKTKNCQLILELLLPSFEQQCRQVKILLLEKNLFLRVHEIRKRNRYMIEKGPKKNELFTFSLHVLKKNLMDLILLKY